MTNKKINFKLSTNKFQSIKKKTNKTRKTNKKVSSYSTSNSQKSKKLKTLKVTKPSITKYKGYIGNYYRLVFEYPKVKPYPKTPPLLLTILENNIIEEVIKPLIKNKDTITKGKALICFNNPKTINKLPTEHQIKTKIFSKVDNFLNKELEDKIKVLLTSELINNIRTKIPGKFPKSIGQEIEKQISSMKGKLISKTLVAKIFKNIKKDISPMLTKKMMNKLLDPFIWKEKDKNILVQTWPVDYNESFKKSYIISNKYITGDTIFNKQNFPPKTIDNFKMTCSKLFGKNSVSSKNPIHLCYWKRDPTYCNVYEGLGKDLLQFLLDHKSVMKKLKIMKIINKLNNYSFTSIIKINGKISGNKNFYIKPNDNYVLYTKFGYQTMAIMTPSKDFMKNNELIN